MLMETMQFVLKKSMIIYHYICNIPLARQILRHTQEQIITSVFLFPKVFALCYLSTYLFPFTRFLRVSKM